MNAIKSVKSLLIMFFLLTLTTLAYATPFSTNVQFNPTPTDTNAWIEGIVSFQWQDTTNVAIEQTIDVYRNGSLIYDDTTLAEYFGNPGLRSDGDEIEMTTHAQARVAGFTPLAPADFMGLNSDWEVTMALSLTERARYEFSGSFGGTWTDTLNFSDTSPSGSYKFYLDDSVNSDHATGEGFNDGDEFLRGSILTVRGNYASGYEDGNLTQSNGNVNLLNSIAWYDDTIIDAHPNGPELVGSTFNTNIILAGGPDDFNPGFPLLQPAGGTNTGEIGLPSSFTYNGSNALLLRAQGSTQFTGTVIPEPDRKSVV